MGAGGFAPSLGCFCAYIGGRRGISALFILPTQKPWFPHVVSLDGWVVLRDYFALLCLVPCFLVVVVFLPFFE